MKAFLLAAGLGTRLRPITNDIPKCMVPICGYPLLYWWVQLFKKYGINDVLINTHYLPDTVRKFLLLNNSENNGVILHEFYEEKLLGSGGTVRANFNFVKNDNKFLICYADNLTNINLSNLISFHDRHKGILTMGLFYTNTPKQCGIATIDKECLITDFVEKPITPGSNLANAGIYVCSSDIFSYLPNKDFIDFGKDILPLLIGKMYGMKVNGYLKDIGTIENYNLAQKEWRA